MPSISVVTYPMPFPMFGVAPDASGNIWTTDSLLSVYKIRGSDGAVLASRNVFPHSGTEYLAFDGTNMWVTVPNSAPLNTGVIVVDPTDAIIAAYETEAYTLSAPDWICFDGTDMWLWCVGVLHPLGRLFKMRLDGTVLANYTGTAQADFSPGSNLCYDGTHIWMTDRNGNLYQMDAATCTNIAIFPVTDYTTASILVGTVFDGANIWVTDNTSLAIKIDPATGAKIASYAAGNGPQAMAFDGSRMWILDAGDNTVTLLDSATGTLIGNFPLGTSAVGLYNIAWDGTSMWVSDTNSELLKLTFSLLNPGKFYGTSVAFSGAAPCVGGTK